MSYSHKLSPNSEEVRGVRIWDLEGWDCYTIIGFGWEIFHTKNQLPIISRSAIKVSGGGCYCSCNSWWWW